jgi:predicted nuclease with TOPRIM domain
MPQLSDEYSELQEKLVAIELEKRELTHRLRELADDEQFVKKRMQYLKDEIEGRVQLSIFDTSEDQEES